MRPLSVGVIARYIWRVVPRLAWPASGWEAVPLPRNYRFASRRSLTTLWDEILSFDRFNRRCGKYSDQPLVIGFALQVGGRRWLRPVDAVVDRQPYEHKAIAEAI